MFLKNLVPVILFEYLLVFETIPYDNSSNVMHTCENTPNSVGLTLGNDMVMMWYLLTWESPIGKCECEDDSGNPIGFTRYFWTPLTSNETTSLNYASSHSKWVVFIIFLAHEKLDHAKFFMTSKVFSWILMKISSC